MEFIFEFNIDKLIGKPEFRVNIFMEFYYSLVEFGFWNLWGLDEERYPFVSTETV